MDQSITRTIKPTPQGTKKRIAIVHDALAVPSGSEKVALFLSMIFPEAPIFTSAYLPENTYPEFRGKQIITLPFGLNIKTERHFKRYFPWWYLGFSSLKLHGYDLILSSANYLAKYINPPQNVPHVCYLHNPFRFLWKPDVYSINSVPYNKPTIRLINIFLPFFRKIDVEKTRKIPYIIANSKNIAQQIQTIYGRTADVIYPPIQLDQYHISTHPNSYYLFVGRLISHKRVDLAIQACNQLGRKLIIAGEGLERSNLERIAGPTVEFLGQVTNAQLKDLYANCRGLIFPSDEDFGLVPVEVQAAGRPVIAYGSGGALETVVDQETGIFFPEQSADAVCEAIIRFEQMQFDPAAIRANAARFDFSIFEERIREYVLPFLE